jgi:2-haloacid dehalogenase
MPSRRTFVTTAIAGAAFGALPADTAAQRTADSRPPRRRILVFDVNETMLDVNALEPHFARVFGDGRVLREWFSTLLLYSNVATLAGPYADFGTIAGAALAMVAEGRGTPIATADRDTILQGTRSLPAHADVRPGLQRLRDEGFRLVTLTNSAPAMVQQQIENAGLADMFERAFSVDAVQRFKPAAEPYRHVAQQLGAEIGDLRMIAAHAHGRPSPIRAVHVGITAAALERRGGAARSGARWAEAPFRGSTHRPAPGRARRAPPAGR